MSGMGVVFQDYDNDGRPDVIVTELPREIYGVYHNEGNGTFSYGSLETGLGVLSSGSSGWGVGLEDFGNDGWKDLFVAQGHVLDNVEQIDPSLHYWELPLLAMNHNGHFERVDSGSATPAAGRGAAFGDLNNDGCHLAARHTQQSGRLRGARPGERADPIRYLCRKLSFIQRQAPAFRIGSGRDRESRNRLAFGNAPAIE